MEEKQLVVLGGGPGGYAAAFHAADLGIETTLVDEAADPGGVCLYRGCIPSKALLHAARLINETREAEAIGLRFEPARIDLDRLRSWKDGVVQRLTGGLGQLRDQRRVEQVQGRGRLVAADRLEIATVDGSMRELRFRNLILATGSEPSSLPFLPAGSDRIWDSTSALALARVPESLLVIGGGYIGLELGSVYAALGSRVTVVEMTSGLLPGCDRDLVRPLQKRLDQQFHEILLETKVTAVEDSGEALVVRLEGEATGEPVRTFDAALVAVGRRPLSSGLGLEQLGIELAPRGFVPVDHQMRTSLPNIFAIGDVAGEPMLAHKATAEGKVAAEVVAGRRAAWDVDAIPAVVFTDPEVAWCGLTETQAKTEGRSVRVARFPWGASGRALTLDRIDGLTKVITSPDDDRILGVGIVGSGAGELIAEGCLAVEMGANARDLELTVHPHPTLTETLMEAGELVQGPSIHLYQKKS